MSLIVNMVLMVFFLFCFPFNFSGAGEGVRMVHYSADIDTLCVSMVAHGADMDMCILDCFHVLFISSLIMPCIFFFCSLVCIWTFPNIGVLLMCFPLH